jgi:hypothetical protein
MSDPRLNGGHLAVCQQHRVGSRCVSRLLGKAKAPERSALTIDSGGGRD